MDARDVPPSPSSATTLEPLRVSAPSAARAASAFPSFPSFAAYASRRRFASFTTARSVSNARLRLHGAISTSKPSTTARSNASHSTGATRRIFSAAVAAHRYAARPSAGDDSSPSSAFHAMNRASNGAHRSSVTARRHAGTAAKTSSARRRNACSAASSANARAAAVDPDAPAATRVASAPVAIAQRSRKRSNAARTLGVSAAAFSSATTPRSSASRSDGSGAALAKTTSAACLAVAAAAERAAGEPREPPPRGAARRKHGAMRSEMAFGSVGHAVVDWRMVREAWRHRRWTDSSGEASACAPMARTTEGRCVGESASFAASFCTQDRPSAATGAADVSHAMRKGRKISCGGWTRGEGGR